MKRRSLVATVCGATGLLAAALATLGPLAAATGQVAPMTGFLPLMAGAALGVLALLLAVPALWVTRARGSRSGRGAALTGLLLGGALTAAVVFVAAPSSDLPRINDITTDVEDPPVFRAAAEHPPNRDRDLGYPGADFAALQRQAYPHLAPIPYPGTASEAFATAEAAARQLGWNVVAADPQAGRLEAYEVSDLFRFVDDVVIRVREADDGAIVDVRSKSRDGRGDLGANAERIRRFRAELLGR